MVRNVTRHVIASVADRSSCRRSPRLADVGEDRQMLAGYGRLYVATERIRPSVRPPPDSVEWEMTRAVCRVASLRAAPW
jgi:hypothetical protein